MEFIELKNADCYARILLKGAEPVVLQRNNGNNVLWEKNTDHWSRVAPHLFPIVGRVKDDRFTHNGKTYRMSQHGFARDFLFTLALQSKNRAVFVLEDSEETRENYPFGFRFEVVYELDGNCLTITYCTMNTGQETLPYSVGGYPGFALSDSLEQYELHFERAFESERWKLKGSYFSDEAEIMQMDKTFPLNDQLFAEDAIVFFQPPFQQVALVHLVNGKCLTMECTNWEAIGFWTKSGAPFFCIEPWWGHADHDNHNGTLMEKAGIHLLEPGKTETFSYKIILP